jgi:tRNA A37 methylthiotransferase MiaB
MPGQVPAAIKAERARAMRAAAAASSQAFRRQFLSRTMDVLWESSRPGERDPVWSGLTSNYLRVHTVHAADLSNTITPTRLEALAGEGMRGNVETQKAGDER